jgi:uncharacterized OsmC-like protein/predicted DsbA family dithiol-disulfide isomerase
MSYFNQEHPTVLSEPVGPNDHARGPASAEVTLVEYGDFACPACRATYGTVRELLNASPDVRFVFRANPRSHLFPDAEPAAEAAEIAAAHGKFWEMHDRLFQLEGPMPRARLVALAAEIGLDAAQFERDLADGAYRGVVKAQEVSGWHSHVLSTPTFFINGIRFEDALDRLPDAVARARRRVGALHAVFRDGRVESTDRRRRQLVTVGPHRIVSDLPADEDGEDAGPGPHDLLLAALGACTAMTIQWYAEKYHLALEHVEVRLSQARTDKGHVFRRSLRLVGNLSQADRAKLERAADACPVSRTLTGGITIETRAAVEG